MGGGGVFITCVLSLKLPSSTSNHKIHPHKARAQLHTRHQRVSCQKKVLEWEVDLLWCILTGPECTSRCRMYCKRNHSSALKQKHGAGSAKLLPAFKDSQTVPNVCTHSSIHYEIRHLILYPLWKFLSTSVKSCLVNPRSVLEAKNAPSRASGQD